MFPNKLKFAHPMLGIGQPQQSIDRRNHLIGIKGIESLGQTTLRHFFQQQFCSRPVFPNLRYTHRALELHDAIFGVSFA